MAERNHDRLTINALLLTLRARACGVGQVPAVRAWSGAVGRPEQPIGMRDGGQPTTRRDGLDRQVIALLPAEVTSPALEAAVADPASNSEVVLLEHAV
jgi:hypothetical protein